MSRTGAGLFASAQTFGMALRNVGRRYRLHAAVWCMFTGEAKASKFQLTTLT